MKGDWAEYGHTLDIPIWNDGLRPCFGCNVSPSDLYVFEGAGATSFPFRENGNNDYEAACARCEIWVRLDGASHAVVLALLANDTRATGSRGRALTRSIPELQLEVGDRLEPSATLPDVAEFDSFPPPFLGACWYSFGGDQWKPLQGIGTHCSAQSTV